MKRKFILFSMCFLFLSSVVKGQNGNIINVNTSDDVFVYGDGGNKSASNGDNSIVRCFYNDGASAREMIFLKFDLQEVRDIIENNNKRMVSASLKLYGVISPGGGGSPATPAEHLLKVFNMTAANPDFLWTEQSLSYNSWLGNGNGTVNSGKSDAYYFRRNPDNTVVGTNNGNAAYLVASLSAGEGEGWYQWDVSKSVSEYIGGELSLQICDDYIMRLPNTTTGRSYATFHSKENASGNTPYLEIELEDIPAEENFSIVRGNQNILKSYYNDAKNYRYMSFLKFDLSGVAESSEIESVKLKMYAEADEGGGINTFTGLATPTTHTVAVYNVNNYGRFWSESDFMYMDWLYKYGYNRTPSDKIAEQNNIRGEGWVEWDITNSFKQTLINGEESLSLSVCDTYIVKTTQGTNKNSYVRFHSKENPSNYKPRLEITLSPSTAQKNIGQFINHHVQDRSLSIINSKKGNTHIMIMDISGRLIHSAYFNHNYEYTLPEGSIYILRLNDNENITSKKIIIK